MWSSLAPASPRLEEACRLSRALEEARKKSARLGTLTTTLLCKIRQTQRLRDGIPRNAKTDILVRDHGPKSPRY